MQRFRPLLLLLALLWGVPAVAGCPAAQTVPIADLRSGQMAVDRPVTVEGVVTARFMGKEQLGGFYLQQQRGNAPPKGIFIYAPRLGKRTPRPGRHVQVAGTFVRFYGRPQITRPTDVHACGEIGIPEPYPLTLPNDAGRLSAMAATLVHVSGPLHISGHHELGRYGNLTLSAGGRLLRAQRESREAMTARRIILDDGSYRRNPRPIPYLDRQGTRRSGTIVDGVTGILTHAFGAWRLHPTEAPKFRDTNPRPPAPPSPGENLRIATFNVENYFLKLGARGAENGAEQRRQRAKLRATVNGLNADILALVELENRDAAVADLTRHLNKYTPPERHYRAAPHPDPGDDAIRVALLYRPERVRLLGSSADADAIHNRPPLLGWFQPIESGSPFGVVTVHFKAKSGCPKKGDINEGSGCWNRLRTAQAERLQQWLALQKIERDAPIVIAGDINAYRDESPIRHLYRTGMQDLITPRRPPDKNYTYLFHALAGRLDYLLAGEEIKRRMSDAGIWHINADEPRVLAYRGATPVEGPWRASDHDPVWIDLAPTLHRGISRAQNH